MVEAMLDVDVDKDGDSGPISGRFMMAGVRLSER